MRTVKDNSVQLHLEEEKYLGPPFLFRFAQPCLSPSREQTNSDYVYDEDTDLVRWLGAAHHPPAIEVLGKDGPKTKKCDIIVYVVILQKVINLIQYLEYHL